MVAMPNLHHACPLCGEKDNPLEFQGRTSIPETAAVAGAEIKQVPAMFYMCKSCRYMVFIRESEV